MSVSLTFRDLKQQKFELAFEPSDTIQAVKEKLSQEKGWDAAQIKLIYSGKILSNDTTVEKSGFNGGFIVCMVSKPKAAPAPAKEPATPAKPATTAATPSAPVVSSSSSSNAPAAPATPSPAAPAAQAAGSSISQERAEAIANLEAMGFARPEIEQAMRAAYYNPDRAVEYLLNGIPENLRTQAAPPSAPAPAATPAASAPAAGDASAENQDLFQMAANAARGGSGANPPAGGAGGQAGLGNLDFLRNNAQFQQLRQVVQQQPHMLEPILQQVAAGNPQLAAIISQHPEQFLQLLSEDAGDDDVPLPPGVAAVSVTEEERDAIERLCRLGFDREAAIQAYFACDKNEELAANFLFDQPEDEDPVN